MKPIRQLLIVDDNPADVGLAREALKQCTHGCQINTVEDGVEALAYLARRDKYKAAPRPDLVILDLNLPKRDGLSVLAAMRAGPDLRCIPVIIFSTSRLAKDIFRSYSLGANCYVCKPGNLPEFFAAMKSIEQFWFGSATLLPQAE